MAFTKIDGTQVNGKVSTAGDTMTGQLTIRTAAGNNALIVDVPTGSYPWLELRENNSTAAGAYWQIYKDATDDSLQFYNGVTRAKIASTGAVSIQGTTTNDSAAAGFVGETISASTSMSPGTSAAGNGAWTNITSVALTAGNWLINGMAVATWSGVSGNSYLNSGIGTASAASTGMVYGISQCLSATASGTLNGVGVSIPPIRVSLSGNATYYLNAEANYSGGTPKFGGSLSATRVR